MKTFRLMLFPAVTLTAKCSANSLIRLPRSYILFPTDLRHAD